METFAPYELAHARQLDATDALPARRGDFHVPQHGGSDVVYFTGNSLGLQPKAAEAALRTELNDWAEHGVEGHFRAQHPWVSYHERFAQGLSHLVGAKANEVVAMNALTVNLHLLLVSFYRPSGKRSKILCEAKAFPSDQYALASQVRFHGGDPAVDIIEVAPREGSSVIEEADIEAILRDRGDEIALVMMGGVQYFTGQWLDMPRITTAAHAAGALCGFDLAHAVGNVPLDLHAWNVDFACWCTYKYLNSGPGAVAGAFVHERHVGDDAVPRFEGWWGHNAKRRFLMEPQFDSMGTAEAWQMSNAPVFNMAIHAIALEQFTAAGMAALRAKSLRLTAYLEEGIAAVAKHNGARLEVITPANPARRGCQLSLVAHGFGRELFQALTDAGVVVDWREPNVIRMAPVPMYNTFEDIARFVHILKSATQPH